MRTDAIIDRKQVRCPHASAIGFSKQIARVGDLIAFNLSATGSNGEATRVSRLGRMIGRIAFAPALSGDANPVKNHILVVMLGNELDHLAEFWVNPEDVYRVTPIDSYDRLATVGSFLSDELLKTPIDEVRLCVSELWSSLPAYKAYQEKKRAELKDFNARHPRTTEHVAGCDFCTKFQRSNSEEGN